MSALAASRSVLRGAQSLLPKTTEGIVILAYHLVEGGTGSPVDIPLESFRRQLQKLRTRAEPLGLREGLERIGEKRGRVTHRPSVVLTFDDAYENFHRTVWPLLRELRLPVTLYVPTGFIDGEVGPPIRGTEGWRAASWDQLEELAAEELVTIGSHGVNHVNLARASSELVWSELVESRARLEDRLGTSVEHFCYPEGGTSRRTENLAKQVYTSAAAAGGRRVPHGFQRLAALPRIPVRRDMEDSLESVLTCSVWLEEWAASRVRGLRAAARSWSL